MVTSGISENPRYAWITCSSLYFDLFILFYSLFAFSARALILQQFSRKLFPANFDIEDAHSCVKSISY